MSSTQNTVSLDDLKQTAREIDEAGDRLRQQVERLRDSHEVMECDRCGHRVMACIIDSDPCYSKRISNGLNVHGPGDGEPPEDEIVCPECGAEEPFSVATICSECDDYPCTCS